MKEHIRREMVNRIMKAIASHGHLQSLRQMIVGEVEQAVEEQRCWVESQMNDESRLSVFKGPHNDLADAYFKAFCTDFRRDFIDGYAYERGRADGASWAWTHQQLRIKRATDMPDTPTGQVQVTSELNVSNTTAESVWREIGFESEATYRKWQSAFIHHEINADSPAFYAHIDGFLNGLKCAAPPLEVEPTKCEHMEVCNREFARAVKRVHELADLRDYLRPENKRLREVLAQLVAAKDEKDANGDTEHYRALKSGTWENARNLLNRKEPTT